MSARAPAAPTRRHQNRGSTSIGSSATLEGLPSSVGLGQTFKTGGGANPEQTTYMSEENADSGSRTDVAFPAEDANSNARIGAANRLERHLDEQLTSIQRIDDKAEHITRLLGVLLGLVFTAVSVVSQLSVPDSGGGSSPAAHLGAVAVPTEVAFLLGVLFLLSSLFGSVITYLSSVVRRGLHPNVGHLLSREDYETGTEEHVRRVLGTYGYNIRENHEVLMTNASRLRLTFLCLLLGAAYLSVAGVMVLEMLPIGNRWNLLVATSLLAVALSGYVLSGRFLTLNPLTANNE